MTDRNIDRPIRIQLQGRGYDWMDYIGYFGVFGLLGLLFLYGALDYIVYCARVQLGN